MMIVLQKEASGKPGSVLNLSLGHYRILFKTLLS
jgi:hypothetical protein